MTWLTNLRKLCRTAISLSVLGAVVASLSACERVEESGASLVDVAQAAARQEDRVSPHDLATWLIEGNGDFVLVDVRMPEEYEAAHIEGARNIPIAQLAAADAIAGLPADRKVVVYSNGSENAAKAVVMLRLSGVNAHLLVGGYNAWHARVLNPDISEEELDGETLQVSQQRAYACYFVGECAGTARKTASAGPFVPPVVDIPEEEDALPPPAKEEGC